MRHKKKINHLGRKSEHRKAMLSNMASSLILHKRITTTLAKAKALRSYIEPMITKAKEDSTHSRRLVFSQLQNKEAVSELFREIAQKIADRPGGYTRILKVGPRLGDNAEMCMMELVDYNELMLEQKEEQKGRAARRRRSTSRKKDEPAAKVKGSKTVGAPAETVSEEAEPETGGEVISEVTEEVEPEVIEEAAPEVIDEVASEITEEMTEEEPEKEK